MRGLLFFAIFAGCLPLVFFKTPFVGVMMWFVFSIGNPHRATYGFFSTLPYAVIIAVATILAWLTTREKRSLPLSPFLVLTIIFACWITLTSFVAPYSGDDLWAQWNETEKMILMTIISYTLVTSRERLIALIACVTLSVGFWGVKGGIFTILHGGAYRVFGPSGSVIDDNNALGIVLDMVLPLLFFLWQIAKHRHIRTALLVIIFLAIVGMLFTYSRGALIGAAAMTVMFWIRARSKVMATVVVVVAGLFIYNFAPATWFSRMNTIETYESEDSATSRIYFWKIAMEIAAKRPLVGGGFKVTHHPDVTNQFLFGSGVPLLNYPRAVHSIYFQTLADHGYVGLALFLLVGVSGWINAHLLMVRSRGRQDLKWANFLGRTAKASLVGFWVGGATASLSYYDGYWALLMLLDAARRQLGTELAAASPAREIRGNPIATVGDVVRPAAAVSAGTRPV